MKELVMSGNNTNEKTSKSLKKYLTYGIVVVLSLCVLICLGGVNASRHALNHANLTLNDVTFLRFQPDFDDFILKYEVSWYQNQREVEYTIHGINGYIFEIDY